MTDQCDQDDCSMTGREASSFLCLLSVTLEPILKPRVMRCKCEVYQKWMSSVSDC